MNKLQAEEDRDSITCQAQQLIIELDQQAKRRIQIGCAFHFYKPSNCRSAAFRY